VGHETMSFYNKKGHLKLLTCELNVHGLKRKFIVWLTQFIHGLFLDSTVGKENNMFEYHAEGVRGRWKKQHKLHSSANIGMIKPRKMNWGGNLV
jgi:hypothetical protein